MQGLNNASAFDTFDRLSERVDQIEAEAEATTELGQRADGDTLQQKFKALESGSVGRKIRRWPSSRPTGSRPGTGTSRADERTIELSCHLIRALRQ